MPDDDAVTGTATVEVRVEANAARLDGLEERVAWCEAVCEASDEAITSRLNRLEQVADRLTKIASGLPLLLLLALPVP